jgi:hypothetical protein
MTKASSFLLRALLPLAFPEGLFPVPEVAVLGLVFPPTGFPEGLDAFGATSSQKPPPPTDKIHCHRNWSNRKLHKEISSSSSSSKKILQIVLQVKTTLAYSIILQTVRL